MLAIVEHKCNVYTSSASVTLHEIYTRERESERESGSEKKIEVARRCTWGVRTNCHRVPVEIHANAALGEN